MPYKIKWRQQKVASAATGRRPSSFRPAPGGPPSAEQQGWRGGGGECKKVRKLLLKKTLFGLSTKFSLNKKQGQSITSPFGGGKIISFLKGKL